MARELENGYAAGHGVAIVGEGEAVVTYVGEVATLHKLHWGLDSDGKTAALVAAFAYPQSADD